MNSATAESPGAKREFVASDSSKGRIARIGDDGKTIWEHKIGPLHDFHWSKGDRILFQTSWTDLLELETESGEVVWKYDAKSTNSPNNSPVEVHAFERTTSGDTMIAESGRTRIIVVSSDGKLLSEVPLKVAKSDAHHDTRLVRLTPTGNFLVAHENDGVVREYDRQGKVVWEFEVPLFDRARADGHGPEAFGNQLFSAYRLANGNTLIGTGNGHSVLEVTPDKKIVWSLMQDDLPGIRLAWVTSLQVLPSGNIVITNCHAGPENPQIIEVTRDKKVVWTFKDFERFGNSLTNVQVLSVDGKSILQ